MLDPPDVFAQKINKKRGFCRKTLYAQIPTQQAVLLVSISRAFFIDF